MFGISKINWIIIALLVIIALHVRASFEYNGFAKNNIFGGASFSDGGSDTK